MAALAVWIGACSTLQQHVPPIVSERSTTESNDVVSDALKCARWRGALTSLMRGRQLASWKHPEQRLPYAPSSAALLIAVGMMTAVIVWSERQGPTASPSVPASAPTAPAVRGEVRPAASRGPLPTRAPARGRHRVAAQVSAPTPQQVRTPLPGSLPIGVTAAPVLSTMSAATAESQRQLTQASQLKLDITSCRRSRAAITGRSVSSSRR